MAKVVSVCVCFTHLKCQIAIMLLISCRPWSDAGDRWHQEIEDAQSDEGDCAVVSSQDSYLLVCFLTPFYASSLLSLGSLSMTCGMWGWWEDGEVHATLICQMGCHCSFKWHSEVMFIIYNVWNLYSRPSITETVVACCVPFPAPNLLCVIIS